MHPWHLPGPSIQKVLSAWKGGFVWQPLTFGVRGRCPYHSLCSPGLRCSGHLGFFLEIFHQTWISEELGNKKTCTFLWEGEVKRGTRRKERSLLRKGMGQGGGGTQWARGDRLGGPGGWTVTLGAGPCPVQPSVQNRALKVGDQGQISCKGVLNSGTQRPANMAWRTPTLPRHVLLPTQSLKRFCLGLFPHELNLVFTNSPRKWGPSGRQRAGLLLRGQSRHLTASWGCSDRGARR